MYVICLKQKTKERALTAARLGARKEAGLVASGLTCWEPEQPPANIRMLNERLSSTPGPARDAFFFFLSFFFFSVARACVCSYPQARPHHQILLFLCTLAAAVKSLVQSFICIRARARKKKTRDQ